MEGLSSQPNDTNSGEAEVSGLRQSSCGYIADNIVDDFVENIVINIVLLLELFSAECSWQKTGEFGLTKGLVGPQNKHRNK